MTTPRLTTAQLAERLGRKPTTVRTWRKRKIGPAYIQEGRRSVLYRLEDVEAWETLNRKEPKQ